MIMPPTDNRTPVVVQTFTDITITLEDGGPDRWASGDLGTNFSDPDGDQLSYSAGSSNESVAGAVISEPGPIVIVQAQSGGGTTITITARDLGGLTATQSFRVTVNDRPDHSNTPAGATAIALSESFQGRVDSPNDVDYFRLRVDVPGTLTIRTTGNADPDIAVFDGAGNEVPGASGSWIGSITQDILDRGHDLLVRFSGGNAGGEYTGSTTLDQRSQTSPDLSVGSPTVSDTDPETGATFTLSALVRNDGDEESPATTLRYYRSTDATITTSDTEVGTDAVGALAASGTSSGSVDLTAPSTAGAYYYGACVDAVADESDTTNNCSASVQVTVAEPPSQNYPDLEVGTPTVSDTDPETGATFTLSALVRNDGDEESPATTLRYYRSTDATITTSDTAVGTGAVARLAASGSRNVSVDLTAPGSPGTYYYGACADAVAGESNAANNCSASVAVTVLVPGEPDLVVSSPSVSNSAPAAETGFTLSALVRNDGNEESPATTLHYYRSTDATITTSDTAVGTGTVAKLAASGSRNASVDLTAPSNPGTYYYGACVDAVAGESNAANNCSASVKVTVPVPGEPDLVVSSPSVSDTAPVVGTGFTLSAMVRNNGNEESPATTLHYYRSTDATITTSDTAVGTDAVARLAASGSRNASVDLTAPSNPGTYYYGACVDAVAGESNTANNCSAAEEVTVLVTSLQLEGQPDLEVGTPTVDDSSPETGATFTLSATVSNAGDGEAPATTLRYYRSTDATITTADTSVGTDAVGALSASGTSAESISLTAPATAGAYYYGACVDAVADESDTTDNCSASVKVDVEAPKYPNLEVGTPTVSDSAPETGASFTLSATVSNAGDGEAPAATLRYYRSTDATITTADTAVGTDAVGVLAASGTSAQSISLTAPATAGPYYYGACVDAVAEESDTADNCSASVKVDVEAPKYPNLEVGTPTVSDSAPETGASFTLSATVSNAGDEKSAASTLRYYRSTNSTISSSDTQMGTDAVGALAVSGTSAESISLTAPSTAGTYYYGACVDAVTDESDTTNNCSSSVTIAVEEESSGQPDLRIVGVSAGTPLDGVGPGTLIQFSASVRNYGDANSDATTLRYYRSTDATITTSDTEVGTDEVSALVPSAQVSEGIDLHAPSTAGTYYYGACVDAVTGESNTTNNCSGALVFTVPEPEPDLVVGSPTVNDSSPASGASFTLSATVWNAGGAASLSTTLRYYRSTDATITTSDTSVGTDAVGALAASGTSSESTSLTAPSSPGTYYYGACVDTVTDESDTTNNCSSSVTVTVPEPEPDLVVGSPTASDSSPASGASFTLSATVRNAGGAASLSTTLRYFRSTDATVTTSDTSVGTDAVGALAASGTSSESISLTAPSSPGTYYYGACVDTVTDESDTTNNCSSSATVTVPEPEPDLVVGPPTVSDSRPASGASFTLSTTVRNAGGAASLSTTLRYYRSTDATITTSDTSVGTDAVGALAAAGTSGESISLTAPSSAGTYYYGACVDTVTGESDTTNNCSSSVTVTVAEPEPQPDLVVGSASVEDSNLNTGDSFTLSATVSNAGDEQSAASTLRYYRSTDSTISSSDTQVGTDAVGALAASGTSAESISLTAPSTAGTYYYGACVDAVTDESDTTNNCSSSVTIAVEEESSEQPDLRIVGVSAVTPLDGVGPGTLIQFSASVRNYGDANSDATTLRYYRSTDATITTSDTEVGTDEVSALVPSAQVSEGIDLHAPSTAGTYYYGACVDAVTGESNTTNNCSGSLAFTVPEPEPDLVVGSPTVNDSSPASGASFTLSATVWNAGGAASLSTTLRYYRSTDATITTSDTSVGTDAVGALAASGTSSESTSLTAPSTAGTYYYGACVDTVTGESDTTNNCSSSVTVTVTVPEPEPDLVVGSPTVSDSGPETSGAFTLSATISNDGDGAAAATTLRYYRSTDATITTSDTSVGTDAVGTLAAAGTSSESISLTAPSSAGTYYYGACVDAVTGESSTTNNCSASVQVDVQEPAAHPDLTVTLSITLPGGAIHVGSSFRFGATVENVGEAASDTTTLRFKQSGTEVATATVEGLASPGVTTKWAELTAPLTPGRYSYNACVDAVAGESNTTNNCSLVSIAVNVLALPDLEMGSPSVSDDSPETGGSFTLSATVTNSGDGASAATTLRYYRSADATISSSDTQVGTDAVGALASVGTSAESISLTAPSTAGTYYYGACVDAVTGESSTTNNCSSSVTVTVTEPEPQPDLVVDSFTITLGPTLETSPGALVKLNQRVANVGDAASAATTVRYYRSTDATITTSDTQVSTDAVPELTASSRSVEAENERLPTAPGTYYYGACVDAVAGESNTANNCSRSVKVTVPEPQPDLSVGSASVDDSNLNTGDSFTLSATVRNSGDEQSAASTLRYYRSTDSTISSSDTQVGTDVVGALAAAGTSAESISLTAPSTAGTYYYGACVDAVTDESDTTNNCSSSVTIAVEEESTGQPDLRIVGLITFTPIDGVSPGTRIGLSVNVRNYGDANSDATTLRYYRSTDATISVSDTEVGTDEVSALVPSAQVAEGIDLTAPSTAGTYYYGACVDAVTGESDTTNNCSGSLAVNVN